MTDVIIVYLAFCIFVPLLLWALLHVLVEENRRRRLSSMARR